MEFFEIKFDENFVAASKVEVSLSSPKTSTLKSERAGASKLAVTKGKTVNSKIKK